MPLRLLPWAPEYGSGLQADAEQEGPDAAPTVDITIEGPWAPVQPRAEAPAAVQIIDGVRRVEAHALDDVGEGETAFGLFGSYAVGAVRCQDGHARILDGERELQVRRRYLQAGGEPRDREVAAGSTRLLFRAVAPPRAATPNDLVAVLNRLMLDEEAKLAETLSEDETVLTVVDGPLRLRAPGPRVVGYIKRTYRWSLGATERALLPALAPGERTPLFRLLAGPAALPGAAVHERTAWYLRIADLGPHFHSLAGVVRLEVPGGLPLAEAVRLADQSALALPRLASSPVRDPRAPQNLTPVGALEATLTRRLGDRRWIRRLIAGALRAMPAETSPALGAATASSGMRARAQGGTRW